MLISSSRRKLVLQGLSAIAGAATFIRPSRAQAPAAPSGVASKLAPGLPVSSCSWTTIRRAVEPLALVCLR